MHGIQPYHTSPVREAEEIPETPLHSLAQKTDAFVEEIRRINQKWQGIIALSEKLDPLLMHGGDVGPRLRLQYPLFLTQIDELMVDSQTQEKKREDLNNEYTSYTRLYVLDPAALGIAKKIQNDLKIRNDCEMGFLDCAELYCSRRQRVDTLCFMWLCCFPCLPLTLCFNRFCCGGTQIVVLRRSIQNTLSSFDS
ncbi:MAG: hypothetical protein KBC64_00840 [Simkaniaceae bacterium]|nr:hypothetical protein [Simkaniaceae bacterium]